MYTDSLWSDLIDLLLTEGMSSPIETSSGAPTFGDYSLAVNLPAGMPDLLENRLVATVPGVNIMGYTRSLANTKYFWNII